MDIALLYLLIGIVLLTWSSDRFILGASIIAKHFKVSPLLIGLTLVSLGTSAPEIMVSIMASLNGKPNLAIGNVIGSNIANVGFVLGLAALIQPLDVRSKILKREYLILLGFMLAVVMIFYDLYFSRIEGALLVVLLILLIFWFRQMARQDRDLLADEFEKLEKTSLDFKAGLFWFFVGLVLLPVSAHVVVLGATEIARLLGINEVIIGLTVVAIGTSLPEAAASIAAARKHEQDIALGNVIGSNMLNLVAVLPFVAILAPGKIEPAILYRDVPVMFAFAVLMYLFSYSRRGQSRINRIEGGVLFLLYIAYLIYIVMGEIG